jgi:hypothetical protein
MNTKATRYEEIENALSFLRSLLDSRRYDDFISASTQFYTRFIRVEETREHHEAIFKLLDPIVGAYGVQTREEYAAPFTPSNDSSVCYFLPSLDNDLAHIIQLAVLLRGHGQQRHRTIYIAGFASQLDTIGSRTLALLAREGVVRILTVKPNHQGLVSFCRWFNEAQVGLLIPYSIPTLVPFWLEMLGNHRVAWFITKFELDSFSKLRIGISGAGLKEFEIHQRGGVNWYRSTASLPPDTLFNYQPRLSKTIRLISINREQKINNPVFLDLVSNLLELNSTATFSWTGRERLKSVDDFFEHRGVARQTEFLGWVDPTTTLPNYDIFLDTPSLSGVVAVSAFSSGMPVLFMRGSNSWLEAFEAQISSDVLKTEVDEQETPDYFLAESPQDYLKRALEMMTRVGSGAYDGTWQRQVGQSYFYNSEYASAQHDKVLAHIASVGRASTSLC